MNKSDYQQVFKSLLHSVTANMKIKHSLDTISIVMLLREEADASKSQTSFVSEDE